NEEPRCYTAFPTKPHEISLFKDWTANDLSRSCFVFPSVVPNLLSTWPKLELYAMLNLRFTDDIGMDLDHSKDKDWTLIISFTVEDFQSFQIGKSVFLFDQKKVGDEVVRGEVIVKYEEEGQDGVVFFRKFSISSNNGESLIDNLNLFENDKYSMKLTFKPATYTAKDITFFKKCELNFNILPNAITATPHHNKHTCDDQIKNSIFLKNEFMGVKEVFCSKKGWRGPDGKIIQPHDPGNDGSTSKPYERPMCFTLCSDNYRKVKDAYGKDSTPVKPKPDNSVSLTFKYKCENAAVKVTMGETPKFVSELTCTNSKWSGDGIELDLVKLSSGYKFDTECFGSFKFLKDNCISNDVKKANGCDELTLTNDEITCNPGFVLTLEGKIYKKLKVDKGMWKDDQGTDRGPADDTKDEKKPMCLSKCNEAHVSTTSAGEALTEAALYKWEQSSNGGELKCKDATDILFADIVAQGTIKPYFENWKCFSKDKWKSGSTDGKNLKSITDPAKLKVTSHCFKACDSSKIIDACEAADDCKPYKYNAVTHQLSCDVDYVLFVRKEGEKPEESVEMKNPLECTKKGWKEVGGTINPKFDHKTDKDVKLEVQCIDKCAMKFRENDAKDGNEFKRKYSHGTKQMTCDGTNIVEYQVGSKPKEKNPNDLQCVINEGWKVNGATLIKFATVGHWFTADCVPSCTPDLIKADCVGRVNCKPATFANDRITCTDTTTVLYQPSGNKLEYSDIECTKTSFKNGEKDDEKKIDVPRADLTTKIDVDCISKCDKQFVTPDPVAAIKPQGSNDGLNYKIQCPLGSLHYTTLTPKTTDAKTFYTAKNFVCDPTKGWSADDLEGGNNPFIKFEGSYYLNEATSGCFDFCENRFNDVALNDGKTEDCPRNKNVPEGTQLLPNCEEVKYDNGRKEISCEAGFTMRFGGEDFIQETLKCVEQGYQRTRVTSPLTYVLKFDNKKPEEKFDVYCFNNCHKELVTFNEVDGSEIDKTLND
ncbi:hypothetical protein PENTCL1PPCAC_19036, partial [Pristionchus entomophagus]